LTFFHGFRLPMMRCSKFAESEMRQMGLSESRRNSCAQKAEQRLSRCCSSISTQLRSGCGSETLQKRRESCDAQPTNRAFYYGPVNNPATRCLKGSQSRLKKILDKYPNFSYMDEVLFRLAPPFQQEEEPDEAANTIRNCSGISQTVNTTDKAKDQLSIIGCRFQSPTPLERNVFHLSARDL